VMTFFLTILEWPTRLPPGGSVQRDFPRFEFLGRPLHFRFFFLRSRGSFALSFAGEARPCMTRRGLRSGPFFPPLSLWKTFDSFVGSSFISPSKCPPEDRPPPRCFFLLVGVIYVFF